MKKIMLLILTITLVFSTVYTVSADEGSINTPNSNSSNLKLNNLIDKYNLKDIEKLPEGIQPIEMKNIDEMEKFLKSITKASSVDNSSAVKQELANINEKGVSILATDPYYKYVTVKKGDSWVYGSFYVAADLEVLVTYNKKTITDCSDAYMMMEGFTLGVDYSEAYPPTATVSSDKTKVTLKAKGTIDYYLLADGMIKLYSRPYYYYKTFLVGSI